MMVNGIIDRISSWMSKPNRLGANFNNYWQLHGPGQTESIFFVAILLLSLLLAWCLSLVYPYGFINEETSTYGWLIRCFHWFSPNSLDWLRTIPFAIVLDFASKFPNPTNTIYWLNACMFSLSMSLVFLLGCSLFDSILAGLSLAIGGLIFELASMRVFYSNLQACADPFFAELVYLGVVLALLSWLRNWRFAFICAYLALGLAAFTKAIGLCLLPLWTFFAILAWSGKPGPRWRKYATIFTSLAFLLLPIGLWSLRNLYVYGCFKFSGAAGSSLLLAVLPLLEDQDRVFDDAKLNADFITSVRECERKASLSRSEDLVARARRNRYEDYFIYGPTKSNPFVFLANLVHPDWRGNRYFPTTLDGELLFQVDAVAERLALRIMEAHPRGYIRRVFHEYVEMFSPLAMPRNPWDDYESDPRIAYQFWDISNGPIRSDFSLYPHIGRPNANHSDKNLAAAFGMICHGPFIYGILKCYYASQFVLAHIIFLGAVVCYLCTRRRSSIEAKSGKLDQISVVLMMLFLTSAACSATVAAAQVAKTRYALAGDIELHLMFLVVVVVGVRVIASTSDAFKAIIARLWQGRPSA